MNSEPGREKPVAGDSQSSLNIALRYFNYLNPLTIRKRGPKAKSYFALGLVCFFWGTTWIASREGVQHMPPIQMAGIRQFLGGICYVVFFLLKGVAWPKGKEWWPILVLTFLNFTLSNTLSTWGVRYIPAGLGSIIGAIFPLWLVLISMLFSRAKLKAMTISGLMIGFAGICVIFYEHLREVVNPDFFFGVTISVISTWSWAVGTIYTKKHALYFNPYFALGLQMVISGGSLFIGSHLTGNAIPISAIPWQSWTAIVYLVLFGSVISFMAYLYALQNLSTEQASLYAYINPIVAVLLGAVLFGEALNMYIITGVVITLAGVYIVNRSALKI